MNYALETLEKKLSEIREAQGLCIVNENIKELELIKKTKAQPIVNAINLIKCASLIK